MRSLWWKQHFILEFCTPDSRIQYELCLIEVQYSDLLEKFLFYWKLVTFICFLEDFFSNFFFRRDVYEWIMKLSKFFNLLSKLKWSIKQRKSFSHLLFWSFLTLWNTQVILLWKQTIVLSQYNSRCSAFSVDTPGRRKAESGKHHSAADSHSLCIGSSETGTLLSAEHVTCRINQARTGALEGLGCGVMMYIGADEVQFTLGAQCKHVTLGRYAAGACETKTRKERVRLECGACTKDLSSFTGEHLCSFIYIFYRFNQPVEYCKQMNCEKLQASHSTISPLDQCFTYETSYKVSPSYQISLALSTQSLWSRGPPTL